MLYFAACRSLHELGLSAEQTVQIDLSPGMVAPSYTKQVCANGRPPQSPPAQRYTEYTQRKVSDRHRY